MTYSQLIEFLENRLGYLQMPVNPHASGPRNIFENCPLHDQLTKQLVNKIYKKNHCRHLSDKISRKITERVLQEIRQVVRLESRTDIDRIHFIDDVCNAVSEFFSADDKLEDTTIAVQQRKQTAQIIPFDPHRRRRLRWHA